LRLPSLFLPPPCSSPLLSVLPLLYLSTVAILPPRRFSRKRWRLRRSRRRGHLFWRPCFRLLFEWAKSSHCPLRTAGLPRARTATFFFRLSVFRTPPFDGRAQGGPGELYHNYTFFFFSIYTFPEFLILAPPSAFFLLAVRCGPLPFAVFFFSCGSSLDGGSSSRLDSAYRIVFFFLISPIKNYCLSFLSISSFFSLRLFFCFFRLFAFPLRRRWRLVAPFLIAFRME